MGYLADQLVRTMEIEIVVDSYSDESDHKSDKEKDTSQVATICSHEMKQYHGLNESFMYCTKCDHKEKS